MAVPNPVRIFHITIIANLPAICATGALLSKNVTSWPTNSGALPMMLSMAQPAPG